MRAAKCHAAAESQAGAVGRLGHLLAAERRQTQVGRLGSAAQHGARQQEPQSHLDLLQVQGVVDKRLQGAVQDAVGVESAQGAGDTRQPREDQQAVPLPQGLPRHLAALGQPRALQHTHQRQGLLANRQGSEDQQVDQDALA